MLRHLYIRFILSHILLLIVGLGSWMFHMTLRYEMQLLDELPMIFGSAAQIYIVYEVTNKYLKWGIISSC